MKDNEDSIARCRRCRWSFFAFFLAGWYLYALPVSRVSDILPDRIKFEHISIEQGLSQSAVFEICQDTKGFLWFGTEDGLNRFDGYSFKIYRRDPDRPGSLSNNVVRAIYEDRHGVLWIGTEDGLNRYDREKETFSHFTKSEDSHSLSNNNVLAIVEDKSGRLWVGTAGGLNRLDKERKQFTHYKHIPGKTFSLSNDKVTAIYEDEAGGLWIGTGGGGLNKYNEEKYIFSSYKNKPGDSRSLSNNFVKTIFEDSYGMLWIGTNEGLNRFDREKNVFTRFEKDPNNNKGLSHNTVYSIFEVDTNDLWLGTNGGGINRWNPAEQEFRHLRNTPEIPHSLSNDFVHVIYRDRGGILWVGTEKGINKFDRKKEKFAGWDMEATGSDSMVWEIFEDKEGCLWLGTDGGLIMLNRDTGKTVHWTHEPNDPNSLSHNRVHAVFEDNQGMLWIGTHGGGLNRFDRRKKEFRHYKHDKSEPHGSLSNDNVFAVLEDRAGTLWVGTLGGLNRLDDREAGFFTHWLHDPLNPDSLCNDFVMTMFEDRKGGLWIGTEGGLSRFDQKKETFSSWEKSPDPNSISDNVILHIHVDKSGTPWIGTAWGLNKFDWEKRTFTRFTKKNGLPNDRINGILEDEEGYLWLSTNAGISRFNPQSREFRNYDVHDGLKSIEFNGGSCFKSLDGEMFFGGIKGFNFFYPADIEDNPHVPPVVITGFLVFNKSVDVDSGHNAVLEKSIIETKKIVLPYRDNFFAFEFAALDYTTPVKNKYAYKMERLDKEWIEIDTRKRFASYTSVNPGEYIFKVRGSNNDGKWNEEGVLIKIIITPPIWKTWWFRVFLAVALVLLIFVGYRYRTRRLREELAQQERVQTILRRSRDLAEFRRAEIEKLIASISALLIAVDSNGEIFQWNETAEKMFGIKESGTIGCTFTEVLNNYIPADKLREIMEKGLGEGDDTPVKDFEFFINPRNKGKRLLLSTISPILDRNNKRLGFLLLAEDITNRKEEEHRLLLSQKLESLGQMAGNIAHEIKSPLQYIAHNGQFVHDSVKELAAFYDAVNESLAEIEQSNRAHVAEKIKALIEEYDIEYSLKEIPRASDQIVSGVSTVSKIVKSMKEYSHPGRGVMEKADINHLLESMVVLIQDQRDGLLKIDTEFYHPLPPAVCFPGELHQVFMNLLINAADSIREKGEPGLIKIATSLEGNEIVVAISDTGRGIPDRIKDNIFNPFFTTKEVGLGTGQGLSLAHKIIFENHKGKLHFTSKVGEGTTFYVHLPIQGES